MAEPNQRIFETYDALFEALQSASKTRGYAVSKRRTSEVDKATNRPRRVDLAFICDTPRSMALVLQGGSSIYRQLPYK